MFMYAINHRKATIPAVFPAAKKTSSLVNCYELVKVK